MVVNTLDNNWNFIEKCPIYPNFHYQKVKKKPENKNVYWAITTNNRVKWDYRWLLAVFLKQFYARYLSNKGIGFVIYCYHMMQMYLLSVLTFKVLCTVYFPLLPLFIGCSHLTASSISESFPAEWIVNPCLMKMTLP